jgi:hypothetical protein
MTRKYSSISSDTTLSGGGLSSSATTLTVATGTATTLIPLTLSAGDQYTLAIDPDTTSEEIVFVYSASGNPVSNDSLTVVRGQSGTQARAHLSGATVKHVLTSDDLDYYTSGVGNALTATSTNATVTNKGISLANNTITGTKAQFNAAMTDDDFVTLTGGETLTNKILTSPTLTTPIASIAINSQTASYTLVAGDKSKLVTITSASATTVTVPPSVFSQGDVVYVARLGAGTCAFVAGSGVTIASTPGLNLRAQNAAGAIICTGTNTFLATGDLAV